MNSDDELVSETPSSVSLAPGENDIDHPEEPSLADLDEHDEAESLWQKLLTYALSREGARIDRSTFIRSQLLKQGKAGTSERQIQEAIKTTLIGAGITQKWIDQRAEACIKSRILRASAISFACGIPGGFAMAATIPADLAAFFSQAILLCQELAYLYGWPDLNEFEDAERARRITLFIGAMLGADLALKGILQLAPIVQVQVATQIARQPLTKYGYYNITKQVGRWIGINVTKGTFGRAVGKLIPIIAGFASAGISAFLMRQMGRRLQKHLRTIAEKPDGHFEHID